MKKAICWIAAVAFILLCGVLIWRCAYANGKNTDNIPSLALIEEHGEAYAKEKLAGYNREQLIEVWGEPNDTLSGFFGDVWNLNGNGKGQIAVYYDADGMVEAVKLGEKSGGQ